MIKKFESFSNDDKNIIKDILSDINDKSDIIYDISIEELEEGFTIWVYHRVILYRFFIINNDMLSSFKSLNSYFIYNYKILYSFYGNAWKRLNVSLGEDDDLKSLNLKGPLIGIKIDIIKDNYYLNESLSETKIVDQKGNPLTVFRSQNSLRKQTIDRKSGFKGIYFSSDKESTKIYGKITKEYYLDIKNPLILRDKEWNLSLIPEYLYNYLIKKGYDGAIWIRNGVMYEIVAFYEHQVIEK